MEGVRPHPALPSPHFLGRRAVFWYFVRPSVPRFPGAGSIIHMIRTREASRVHVPGSFLLLLGVSFLLVVLLFYYLFIRNIGRRPLNLGKDQLKLRVWAAKSTGL